MVFSSAAMRGHSDGVADRTAMGLFDMCRSSNVVMMNVDFSASVWNPVQTSPLAGRVPGRVVHDLVAIPVHRCL